MGRLVFTSSITAPPPGGDLTLSGEFLGGASVTPAAMRFDADITGAGLLTPDLPVGAFVYQSEKQDIFYVWDFDDATDDYDYLDQFPAAMNDSNRGYGKNPWHVFPRAGTYTVTCTAYDFYGNSASGSYEVVVADASTVYTAANTIVVATDGDFTGAPAHDAANDFTTLVDAQTRARAINGTVSRIVLKGGQTFNSPNAGSGQNLNSLYDNWRIESVPGFGTGKAIINHADNRNWFNVTANTFPTQNLALFKDIAFTGPWDAETELNSGGFTPKKAVDVLNGNCLMTGCTADGMDQMFGTTASDPGAVHTCVIHNSYCTNWRDYALYHGTNFTAGKLALLGTNFTQKPTAFNGGGGDDFGNQHGPVRLQACSEVYFDCYQGFARTTNDLNGKSPPDQSNIRDHRNSQTSFGYFTRMVLEGGVQIFGGGVAASGQTQPVPGVYENFIAVASARTTVPSVSINQASVARNFIVYRPDVSVMGPIVGFQNYGAPIGKGVHQTVKLASVTGYLIGEQVTQSPSGAIGTVTAINVGDKKLELTGETIDFVVGQNVEGQTSLTVSACTEELQNNPQSALEPCYLYNFTLVNDQSDTQDDGKTEWPVVDTKTNNDEKTLSNYVRYVPQNTTFGDVTAGPLDTAVATYFTPKYLGYRWQNHLPSSGFEPLEQLDMRYDNASPTHRLDYDGGTGSFAIGETVTAGAATAVVQRVDGTTASGSLFLTLVDGTFANNAALTGSVAGAAVCAGTQVKVGFSEFRPQAGSTAYQSATGTYIAPYDAFGNLRGANPSTGWLEPA